MPFWAAQETLAVYQWIVRATVTYFWLFLMTKLMGQREVGRLTLFDFVIAISIGSITASPLSNSQVDLTGAFLSIGTLALIEIIISLISLKSPKFRRVFQGEPIVLIQNGRILEDTMKKTKMNLDDLLMGLRQKKVPHLSDVEFAILEPNGKISIIPKSQARNVKPSDFNLNPGYEGLPVMLIEDGNILQDNLEENNLSTQWLKDQLNKMGIDDEERVMAAMLDSKGRLYVSLKGQENEQFIH